MSGGVPFAKEGGYVSELVGKPATGVDPDTDTIHTADTTAYYRERVRYDPTGGTFTISAPTGVNGTGEGAPKPGHRWGVKNTGTDATAVTIAGNGANIEDPASPGTYAASISLSGAGRSVEWEFDGTNWIVVASYP